MNKLVVIATTDEIVLVKKLKLENKTKVVENISKRMFDVAKKVK